MRSIELIMIALSSIWSNKLRSLLTMLGLIIGISAVVTILSIGEGSKNAIADQLGSLGIQNITIQESRNVSLSPSERLEIEDMARIKTAFPDLVQAVVPSISRTATIIQDIDETSVSMTGASQDTKIIDSLTMVSGRAIEESDILSRRSVIVIDSELSTTLFGEGSSLGRPLIINNGVKANQYVIIGVYEKSTNSLGFSESKIYTPYTTLDKNFNLRGRIGGITLSMTNKDTLKLDAGRILEYLKRIHRTSEEEPYSYFSLDSMLDTVSTTLGQITLLISAIAGISLVVGGIGVMNIMLVSVTERTREIGIRKALGARGIDILVQFLVEAVVICLIGGALGVVFGFIFTEMAQLVMKTEMSLTLSSVLLATLFASAIGIIFGVYPANRASNLDPIEALRYE